MRLRAEHTEPLYYLPSYTAAPTLNSTLRLSLTLTLLLQTPRTLNYRRAARHPIVCARHFVQKLGQVQHTNNKSTTYPQHPRQVHSLLYSKSTTNRISGVWALMSTAVRSVIAVHPTFRMAYIHHIATLTSHMPGGVYNFQGRASFTDVLG